MLHRDRVKARIVRYDSKGRPEGRVLEILERRKAPIIGRLLHESGIWLVAPEDKRYGQDIIVPRNAIAGAKAGQVVAIELTEPPSLHSQPLGRVTEVLGEIDDPGMEIEIAVRKYEVPHLFSAETLAAGRGAARHDPRRRPQGPRSTSPTCRWSRSTARTRATSTTPSTASRPRSAAARAGGWSSRSPTSATTSSPASRSTTTPTSAPPRSTSRAASSRCCRRSSRTACARSTRTVDRLAMVCDMLVDADGEVARLPVLPGGDPLARPLHLHRGGGDPRQHARSRGGASARTLVPHLLDLHEVYRALLKARAQRGAIDFETTETQIVCDENGRIEKIVPRTRTEAHRLIEEAMLAANVCSADFIARAKHPALYRVHEGPTPEKKDAAAELPEGARPRPVDRRRSDAGRVPGDRRTRPRTGPTRRRSTRCCCARCSRRSTPAPTAATSAWPTRPTRTSPARSGAIPTCWCTASSRPCWHGQRYVLPCADAGEAPAKRAKRPPARAKAPTPSREGRRRAGREVEAWEVAGAHCSANERRADEASRDVEAWLKCRYMREHLGEEFGGTVSAVTSFGLFVTLDGLYVEGLVHITELGGEYYRFDEIAPGTARRAHRRALRRRHAGAGAGQPGRPRRPQDRLPHGPRRRGAGRRRAPGATRRWPAKRRRARSTP